MESESGSNLKKIGLILSAIGTVSIIAGVSAMNGAFVDVLTDQESIWCAVGGIAILGIASSLLIKYMMPKMGIVMCFTLGLLTSVIGVGIVKLLVVYYESLDPSEKLEELANEINDMNNHK